MIPTAPPPTVTVTCPLIASAQVVQAAIGLDVATVVVRNPSDGTWVVKAITIAGEMTEPPDSVPVTDLTIKPGGEAAYSFNTALEPMRAVAADIACSPAASLSG